MRVDDLVEDADLSVLNMEVDKEMAARLLAAAAKSGYRDVEVVYDTYAGDNYMLLFRNMVDFSDLAKLCSAITVLVPNAKVKITIEDGELRIDF